MKQIQLFNDLIQKKNILIQNLNTIHFFDLTISLYLDNLSISLCFSMLIINLSLYIGQDLNK